MNYCYEQVTDSDPLPPSDVELETQQTAIEDRKRAIDVLQEEISVSKSLWPGNKQSWLCVCNAMKMY
jgi:hypothetical protein